MGIKGYKQVVRPSGEVQEMKKIIDKWREPSLARVRSSEVIPDTSNRGHTGLSIDHVHFIASSMLKYGFRSRHANDAKGQKGQPHDIPVLVRGGPSCPVSVRSLELWRDTVAREPDLPDVVIDDGAEGAEWFTSLGNGHFTQALNLFRQQRPSVFTGHRFVCPTGDVGLQRALADGVDSIVLRADTPIEARRRVAHLLNATHDYKWTVDTAGEVDISPEACSNAKFTQFEAMSKVVDSEALTALVRLELGAGMDDRKAPTKLSKL